MTERKRELLQAVPLMEWRWGRLVVVAGERKRKPRRDSRAVAIARQQARAQARKRSQMQTAAKRLERAWA